MLAFRAHPNYPEQLIIPFPLQVLNLITSVMTLFPYKVTFTGCRDLTGWVS